MSPKKSSPSSSDTVSVPEPKAVEGGEHHDYFYFNNFTAARPPHLNGENFSSAQPGGSNTQPRRPPSVQDIKHNLGQVTRDDTEADYYTAKNYPSSSRSVNTSSTLKGNDASIQRPHLSYYLDRNYHDETASPLTTQAIAALDDSNNTQVHHGNVNSWLPGAGPNFHADAAHDWSTGRLVSKSGSHTSIATSLSMVVVSSAPDYYTSDIIRDVGRWSDVPADPYTTQARQILDEDMRDQ
ncbi:hypothetical protein F4819DRAFT_409471 [Hypoxylon fuscum]|nr:hypothetical protein F4819DRAFT_409471 [Hypoxylon fuscum]